MTAPIAAESVALPTVAPPNAGGVTAKSFAVLISDALGNPLGEWRDCPIPAVRLGNGSAQTWTFSLARAYGYLDEPGEPGGRGTLAWGNRVDVYVSDPDTQVLPLRPDLAGYRVAGQRSAGGSSGLGRLVWRGTIENWHIDPAGFVTVDLVDIDRIVEGAPIPGTVVYSGDPLSIARTIVHDYLPGLRWDTGNPTRSGQSVTNFTLTNQTVGAALAQLRDLCGSGWLVVLTPYGTVRLFQPNVTANPTHTLIVGVHCIAPLLHKTGLTRRKRIVVTFAQGQTVEARARDYNPNDPRAEFVTADGITNAGDALQLANLTLAARDQVTLNGEVTVLDEKYDIESIQPGDTVRLLTERPAGTFRLNLAGYRIAGQHLAGGGDGYLGYGGQPLVVSGIDYSLTMAKLELSAPQPRQNDLIAQLIRQVASLRAKVA